MAGMDAQDDRSGEVDVPVRRDSRRLIGAFRGRMRRLKTLPVLPTLLTAGNLASGVSAILCAANHSPEKPYLYIGAIMIFVAMVCDMLDGKVARLTRTAGAFGAELDSLADVVSFGVAPAILVHRFILGHEGFIEPGSRILLFITVFYPVMAAIRLARYNVEHSDEGATKAFRGLPSPGAAAIVCAWILLAHYHAPTLSSLGVLRDGDYHGLIHLAVYPWGLIAVSLGAALLMVSTIPYPHVGNVLFGRIGFRKLIIMLLLVSLLVVTPWLTLWVATTGYILAGLGMGAFGAWQRWRAGRHVLDDDEDEAAEDAGLEDDKPFDSGPAPGR